MKGIVIMDFLKTAIAIEDQGFEFYRNLARTTPIRELAGIFSFLAEEELRHGKIFESFGSSAEIPVTDAATQSQPDNSVFAALSQQFETGGIPANDYTDLFNKALTMENESITLYTKALNENGSLDERSCEILEKIISEETRHAHLISILLDILRHPGEWLENAEWRHAETY